MNPDDLDAVSRLVVRLVLVVVEPSRDHGDVVVARELLAELRQQVRGRLDARVVVLVKDEETPSCAAGWQGVEGSAWRLRTLP